MQGDKQNIVNLLVRPQDAYSSGQLLRNYIGRELLVKGLLFVCWRCGAG
jgi:hypothetical protein